MKLVGLIAACYDMTPIELIGSLSLVDVRLISGAIVSLMNCQEGESQ
jgi:hypothetical protein